MADPTQVANLYAWWKADSIALADAATVDTWTDSSGSGFTGSNVIPGFQPTFQTAEINGLPVLRFVAAHPDSLVASASTSLTAQTLFAVVKPSNTTGVLTIRGASVGAGDGGLQYRINAGKQNFVKQNLANIGSSTTTLSTTAFQIVSASWADGASYAFYLDGTADGNAASAVTLTSGLTTAIGINSAGANGGEGFDGDIAEIIVYSSVLSAGDRATVHSYLSDKYGITVSDYVASTGRTAVDLTVVGSTAWTTSAASGTTIAPTYPSGLAQGDVVYTVVHLKPSTAAVTTPTNWSLVGSAVAATSAAQGAGTGPTEVSVFRRVVPSGGLSGTETFNLTSSPNVAQACMIAFRAPGNTPSYAETWGFWAVPSSGTTGATNVSGTLGGGTATGNLTLAAKDQVLVVIAPTDDATSPSVTATAATGATFGSITADPSTHGSSTTGNDISTGLFRVPITAGTSSTAPTITASLATAETMVGFAWRVRGTIDAVTPQPHIRLLRLRPLLVR